ncbi:hypothetical protein ACQPZ2_30530 [Nocardia pseudovaccinii]|uniref:hypothetical protein n=1 Tax=Nocardia pseudovaccinii TaxID=189540 RepID=UPI003D8FB6AD
MKGTGAQLGDVLIEAHRRACVDAQTKADQLLRTADPRVSEVIHELKGEPAPTVEPQPMTEEDIQAADDAYFERMNRNGWSA